MVLFWGVLQLKLIHGLLLVKEAEIFGLREALSWVLQWVSLELYLNLMPRLLVLMRFILQSLNDSDFGIAIQGCHFPACQ